MHIFNFYEYKLFFMLPQRLTPWKYMLFLLNTFKKRLRTAFSLFVFKDLLQIQCHCKSAWGVPPSSLE